MLFMPYNYFFDVGVRKALNLSFTNCIIIIDEAHHIHQSAEEALSFRLPTQKLEVAK